MEPLCDLKISIETSSRNIKSFTNRYHFYDLFLSLNLKIEIFSNRNIQTIIIYCHIYINFYIEYMYKSSNIENIIKFPLYFKNITLLTKRKLKKCFKYV